MLNMSADTVKDIDVSVNKKLMDARDNLKKAIEIKKQIEAAEKMQAARVDKFAKDAESVVGKIDKDEKLKAKYLRMQEEFEKSTEEFRILLESLTAKREQMQAKANEALSLKSGVELVKAVKKRREIEQKVKELNKTKDLIEQKEALESLKKQTQLGLKKI